MRYRDAAHVDLASLHARRPLLGRYYGYLGFGACLLAAAWQERTDLSGMLLICVLVAWLQAWFRAVGSAWRSPLVAAALLCAAALSRPLCAGCWAGAGGVP